MADNSEHDRSIIGDIIMRKYKALPWPDLRIRDFSPPPSRKWADLYSDVMEYEDNVNDDEAPTKLDADQLYCNGPSKRFRPISPFRYSPPRRSPSPSLLYPSSYRHSGSGRRTPSPKRTSYRSSSSRYRSRSPSPEVTEISRRIFDSINEIRRDIQMSDYSIDTYSRANKYRHPAERDSSPRRGIYTRNSRRSPKPETKRICSTKPETPTPQPPYDKEDSLCLSASAPFYPKGEDTEVKKEPEAPQRRLSKSIADGVVRSSSGSKISHLANEGAKKDENKNDDNATSEVKDDERTEKKESGEGATGVKFNEKVVSVTIPTSPASDDGSLICHL